MSANKANQPVTIAEAEEVAAKALLFMVSDDDRFGGLSLATGLSPDDVRAGAGSAQLQASVVEYLISDEAMLLAFAAEYQAQPERMLGVSHVLSELAAGRRPEDKGKRSMRFQPLYPLR